MYVINLLSGITLLLKMPTHVGGRSWELPVTVYLALLFFLPLSPVYDLV